jgi:hypothetical protein
MILLCRYHHSLIHKRGWTNQFDSGIYRVMRPDGSYLGQT